MSGRSGRGAGAGPSAGPSGTSGRGGRRPGGSLPTTRRTTRVPETDPTEQPRRQSTFTSRALVLLLVVAVLGVSYASSIRAWLNQRSEHHALSAQIAAQQAAIDSLRNAQRRWQDPAYIESMARQRFGWVMPGERSYRVIGKDGKVLKVGNDALSGPEVGSQSAEPPWWAGAAGSLTRADATPAAAKPSNPDRRPAQLIGPTQGSSTGR